MAYLGWDSSGPKVNFRLGTAGVSYSLNYSAAKPEEVLLVGDQQLQVGFQAGFKAVLLSLNVTHQRTRFQGEALRFVTGSKFEAVLHSAARDTAVLYDTGAKRGWMVSRLSFLLYAIIAQLKDA